MSGRCVSSELCAGDEHIRAEGAAAGRCGQTEPTAGQGHGEDGAGSFPH